MRSRLAVPLLLLWTLLVWVGRIRNVLADDDLSTGGRTWRLGAAILFVALAVGVFAARRVRSPRAAVVLGALVVWTVGWWTVRGVGILADGSHDTGFKIVHTVLMVVSIVLAMWAWVRRNG